MVTVREHQPIIQPEGWFDGDVARTDSAPHPELVAQIAARERARAEDGGPLRR